MLDSLKARDNSKRSCLNFVSFWEGGGVAKFLRLLTGGGGGGGGVR